MMSGSMRWFGGLWMLLAGIFAALPAGAEELLRPFVLARVESQQNLQSVVASMRSQLTAQGFELVGEYRPYAGVHIVCVTSPALQRAAAASERGGYAAVMRAAATAVADEVEVSFNNPVYLAQAYRLESDLSDVREALEAALGLREDFGAEGQSVDDLRDYNYAFLMEKFHHPWDLGRHASHAQAVAAVEQGLAAGEEGVRQVYRVDIAGSEQTLFGVAFDGGPKNNQYMDDRFIMEVIDSRRPRSSAHLPYEILVDGRQVEALHARFRIAINFPDLKMVGEHSFMDIMSTPPSLENALRRAVGAPEDF